jgi:hypothetical protein
VKPTPEEIDRLLDSHVAVTDAQGHILGTRDLTPAERRAPAVSILVLDAPEGERDADGWQ